MACALLEQWVWLHQTNSILLGVINYCFYLLIEIHPDPSLLLLLILPTQSNKSVKAPFIRDVQKIQYLGWSLVQIQHLASPHALFATRPIPHTIFLAHHSQQCFNIKLIMVQLKGNLIDSYSQVTDPSVFRKCCEIVLVLKLMWQGMMLILLAKVDTFHNWCQHDKGTAGFTCEYYHLPIIHECLPLVSNYSICEH